MRTSGRTGQLIVALGLLLAPLAAGAQPAGKVYRVGVLVRDQRPEYALLWEAFRAGLREHGYVEGRNLALEFRSAEGKTERLPALAAELIGLPVDVFVAPSDQAGLIVKAATSTTPIVFIGASDPVRRGLVASLARPGGNLTGLTWDAAPETWAKSLELLKEILPGMSRVAVLSSANDPAHPDNPAELAYQAAMESGARQLKVTLHLGLMRRTEEFAGALAAIERARVDALVWCVEPPFHDQPLLEFVARRRLPSVGCRADRLSPGP